MGFATGLQAGSNLVSSDIVQKIGLKKERKRAGKLLEEFNAKLEEYQLSDNELSYSEKVQLAVLANQIGSDYAKSLDELNASQSSFDKEKMSQEYQTLRNKNDSLTTLIKEMKDNPYLSQANLLALDEMTGMPFSKLWNKEIIDGIRNEETKQQTLNNVFGVAKELPTEYTMPYMAGQGVPGLEGLEPTPKETPQMSAADSFFIERWQKGEFSTDTLLKHFSAYIDEDKRTTIQKELDYGKGQGITFTPEEVKKKILGTAGGGGTIQDPNDVLFGTNGIMKAYINSGSQLGDEQKIEIRNNYNLIKPSLNADVRTQVEEYLKQIGIDLAETLPTPEPTPEPTATKPSLLKGIWNKLTTPGGTPAYKGTTPQVSQGQKDYTAMTADELADLALFGDTLAIEELKRRGLI